MFLYVFVIFSVFQTGVGTYVQTTGLKTSEVSNEVGNLIQTSSTKSLDVGLADSGYNELLIVDDGLDWSVTYEPTVGDRRFSEDVKVSAKTPMSLPAVSKAGRTRRNRFTGSRESALAVSPSRRKRFEENGRRRRLWGRIRNHFRRVKRGATKLAGRGLRLARRRFGIGANTKEKISDSKTFADNLQGWSHSRKSTCGSFGQVLGGFRVFGKGVVLEKKWQLPCQDNSVTFDFQFARIDSWDGEEAWLWMNGYIRWRKKGYHNHGVNKCGHGWRDELWNVKLRKVNVQGKTLHVRIGTSLNQDANDESWGIKNVRITAKCKKAPKLKDGKTLVDPLDDWNHHKKSHCGSFGTLLGGYKVFGRGAVLKKVFELPCPKQNVWVHFQFARIDSWDGENAWAQINGHTYWKRKGYHKNGQNRCGHGYSDELWNVQINDIRVSGKRLRIRIGTTLNQDANDESWGIKDLRITARCPARKHKREKPRLQDRRLYQDPLRGWNKQEYTTCGKWGKLLGGYATLGGKMSLVKKYQLPCNTQQVTVKFKFARLDSWDNEKAYAKMNGKTTWSKVGSWKNGQQVCGAHYKDELWSVVMKSHIRGRTLKLRIGSQMNENLDNESWGVKDVTIYAKCQKPMDCNTYSRKVAALDNLSSKYAWYKNYGGGSTWKSSIGKHTAKIHGGKVGRHGPSVYLYGSSGATVDWGHILPSKYTICSLSRYNGAKQGRILTGKHGNWLHGHWNRRAGVAHYNRWVTKHDNKLNSNRDWLIMCGENTAPGILRINGRRDVRSTSGTYSPGIILTNGGPHGNEKSDFAVFEILTFNRGLSSGEVDIVIDYLEAKLTLKKPCDGSGSGKGGGKGGKKGTFQKVLHSKNGIPTRKYVFARVSTSQTGAKYSDVMIKECEKHGMKPICDHPKYCKKDHKSLYLGQSQHLAYPKHRNGEMVPQGFDVVAKRWNGVCSYTGVSGNGKALCNIPSNTHAWLVVSHKASEFICGRIGRFSATLGDSTIGPTPAGRYEFRVVTTPRRGKFRDIMIDECKKYSMKPVCDHQKWCKGDPAAIFIGQKHHIAFRPHRYNQQFFPSGWSQIRANFDGLCLYTGNHGNGRGLCDFPYNSHSWQTPSEKANSFMCAKMISHSKTCRTLQESARKVEQLSGKLAWYLDYPGGSRWASVTGSYTAKIHGSPKRGMHNKQFPFLYGDTKTSVEWGNILQNGRFTMCTLTKYNGKTKGRILNGGNGNWLHGHWNQRAGVAHYGRWVTKRNNKLAGNTEWLILCGMNTHPYLARMNHKLSINSAKSSTTTKSVHTNGGHCCSNEKSDFAVLEIITFNRGLSSTEVNTVIEYLEGKLASSQKCELHNLKKLTSKHLSQNRVYIKSSDHELYIHASGGSKTGNKMTLHSCEKSENYPNCQWIFEPSPTRPGLVYIRISDRNLYLHSHGGSKEGHQLTLHPCEKGRNYANCQWEVIPSSRSRGMYYIKASNADLYVHTHGGSQGGGKQTLSHCPKKANHPNCQWQIQGYRLGSRVVSTFTATLKKKNKVPTRKYMFSKLKTEAKDMKWSPFMVKQCEYLGMKPVCDNKRYCEHDVNALYIGQSGHLARPEQRNNQGFMPKGFNRVKRHFEGACTYTGTHGGGKALCNIPSFRHEWLNMQVKKANTFICGRVSNFQATLQGDKGGRYEFRIVTTPQRSSKFSYLMQTECGQYDMKPVCDHPNYCKKDVRSVYIGQTHHIAYRPHRMIDKYFPDGWAQIRDNFQGLCMYTGHEGNGKALCNNPWNSHSWQYPSQTANSFMCGKYLGKPKPARTRRGSEFTGKLGKKNSVPARSYRFSKIETWQKGSKWSPIMRKKCAEEGMKPVCDHKKYCQNDQRSLYIGQSRHLAYPRHRKSETLTPIGFQRIAYQWDGVCSYTAHHGRGQALCNIPNNVHRWMKPQQKGARSFICGRIKAFKKILGSKNNLPRREYKFRVVTTNKRSKNFGDLMKKECSRYGMKPICDHKNYCKEDRESIYLGQDHHLEYRPNRYNDRYFPSGWDEEIKKAFDGLCAYTGKHGGGKALCNIPWNTHSWQYPSDDANSFMCARVTRDNLKERSGVSKKGAAFRAKLGAKNGVPARPYMFRKLQTGQSEGSWSKVMRMECARVGMRPVCDHQNYCKHDSGALYIGQDQHLAYPSHRNNANKVPNGFSEIQSRWDGVCSYTGDNGNGKALCNVPQNTHAWLKLPEGSTTFICGRVSQFVAVLDGRKDIPKRKYTFRMVTTKNWKSAFGHTMVQECRKYGMKPLCDHPNYCRNDKDAVYIGQDHHVEYRPHRMQDKYFPSGWNKIKGNFDGLCAYTGRHGGGKALCNIPWNTHSWQNAGEKANTFMCVKYRNLEPGASSRGKPGEDSSKRDWREKRRKNEGGWAQRLDENSKRFSKKADRDLKMPTQKSKEEKKEEEKKEIRRGYPGESDYERQKSQLRKDGTKPGENPGERERTREEANIKPHRYTGLRGDCPGNNMKIKRECGKSCCERECSKWRGCKGFSLNAQKNVCLLKTRTCKHRKGECSPKLWCFFAKDGVPETRDPDSFTMNERQHRPANARLFNVGYDYPGGDIRQIKDVATVAKCNNFCAEDEQCKSWTYGLKQKRSYTNVCFLKKELPLPRRNSCCISGAPGTGESEPTQDARDMPRSERNRDRREAEKLQKEGTKLKGSVDVSPKNLDDLRKKQEENQKRKLEALKAKQRLERLEKAKKLREQQRLKRLAAMEQMRGKQQRLRDKLRKLHAQLRVHEVKMREHKRKMGDRRNAIQEEQRELERRQREIERRNKQKELNREARDEQDKLTTERQKEKQEEDEMKQKYQSELDRQLQRSRGRDQLELERDRHRRAKEEAEEERKRAEEAKKAEERERRSEEDRAQEERESRQEMRDKDRARRDEEQARGRDEDREREERARRADHARMEDEKRRERERERARELAQEDRRREEQRRMDEEARAHARGDAREKDRFRYGDDDGDAGIKISNDVSFRHSHDTEFGVADDANRRNYDDEEY